VTGAILFFIVLALAATGAMLPWDAAAYWTAVVISNIPHYIPFIGDGLRRLWRGGDVVGPITLTRTFAIHVWVLPFLLISLIGAHLYLLRRHGEFGAWINYRTSSPEARDREVGARIARAEPPYPTRNIEREYAAPEETMSFFPNQLFRDVVLSLCLVAFIFIFGLVVGAPLDERADPATLTYVPTPEWFYLPLDQLLLLTPSIPLIPIGLLGLLGLGALYLLLLPFIDRSSERRPLRRPDVVVPALFLVFTVVLLAILGVNRLYNQ
jgi:quinol-cytochrome oxidoreductase complex cytochrome b subunit